MGQASRPPIQLDLDPHENKDLAESRPEIVAKLKEHIHNWSQPVESQ